MATIVDLWREGTKGKERRGNGIASEKCNIIPPRLLAAGRGRFNEPRKHAFRTNAAEGRRDEEKKKKKRRRRKTSSGRNILIKTYSYDNDFSSWRNVHQRPCSSKASRRLPSEKIHRTKREEESWIVICPRRLERTKPPMT